MESLFENDLGEPLFWTEIDEKNKERTQEQQLQYDNWKKDFIKTFCREEHSKRVLWFLMREGYLLRSHNQMNASSYAIEGKRQLVENITELIGPEELLKSLIEVRNVELKKLKERNDKKKT